MSFREKKNKEVLVFQNTGLGMILAEPSFWKTLIHQHLVNLCLWGERDMPFLSLCICCAAVQNTPYTFLLLALPTLSWRPSFSLCLDCHVCLHISARYWASPCFPSLLLLSSFFSWWFTIFLFLVWKTIILIVVLLPQILWYLPLS